MAKHTMTIAESFVPTLVELARPRNCEVCDSAEPDGIYTYELVWSRSVSRSTAWRCHDCLTTGNGFGIDEWLYRDNPDGTRTNNPYTVGIPPRPGACD